MKYKDIPRKKFTPKQLELLEKLHYVHVYVGKVDFGKRLEYQDFQNEYVEKAFFNLIG